MKNYKHGFLFVLFAFVYLFNALGYGKDIRWFTIVLFIFFLQNIITSLIKRKTTEAIFSGALTYYFAIDLFNLPIIGLWTLFVFSILLSIGIHLVKGNNKKSYKAFTYVHNHNQSSNDDLYEEDSFSLNVSFGESKQYVSSTDFKQGTIQCSFGEVVVYFDNAIIKDVATIDISCSFGEVILYIPKHWNVESDISVLFGEVKSVDSKLGNSVLKLQGNTSFGEIKIKYC